MIGGSGDSTGHWQRVHETKRPAELSWYQPVPERSLELIRAAGVAPDDPIIDVGGGASTLVDHLQAAGYSDVSVLDIAPAALEQAQARLGAAAAQVNWIVSEVTDFEPERRYALWHDRAAFHFLVTPVEQSRYLAVLRSALMPRGHLVLATFGPGGPERCSGLPVQRYSQEQLSDLLASDFQLRQCALEDHVTPHGRHQEFLWSWWQLP